MTEGGFTVFLVDDDADVLKALARLLRASGYDSREFASPEEFLREHDASTPGCAVIDVAMPDLDGLALQVSKKFRNLKVEHDWVCRSGELKIGRPVLV